MALSFPTSKATEVDRINSMILFGETGTGKTILAASAIEIADYAPTLVVDIEGSASGIGRLYPDVDIVQANSFNDLEAIKQTGWRDQHILVVSEEDARLDFVEREFVRRIGDRLYGGKRHG